MFSQKKSIWKRRWFVIAVIGLLSLGYWVNQSADVLTPSDESNKETGINRAVDDDPINEVDQTTQSITDESEDTDNERNEPYYLIKEEDDVISIFYCENGEETFIRNTDIAYSLLSETDQSLFSQGVIKNTEEELEELLQDFGS